MHFFCFLLPPNLFHNTQSLTEWLAYTIASKFDIQQMGRSLYLVLSLICLKTRKDMLIYCWHSHQISEHQTICRRLKSVRELEEQGNYCFMDHAFANRATLPANDVHEPTEAFFWLNLIVVPLRSSGFIYSSVKTWGKKK